MSERFIGIDLGTTNSCVATFENGEPVVIPVKGARTIPSIAAITASGRRLVGALAKRQLVTNPDGTVHSAKRIIGRAFQHPVVELAKQRLPYKIVPGPTGDARIQVHDHVYAVPEISAIVLRECKQAAEAHFGKPVDKAVITVPAYFNDGQRQATKDAGKIAGLDVLRIISEPTSAALAYGLNKKGRDKTRVAVFDLGGGTFDISVLDISGSTFEVVATAGDTYLGGDDFDQRIVEWVFAQLWTEHGVDARHDPMVVQRVRDAAEKAKIELSTSDSTDIQLPFLFSIAKPEGRVSINFDRTISRAHFESLTDDLTKKSVEITHKLLEESKIPLRTIDEVVLVGGMTRMPKVRLAAGDYFGIQPAWGVNPDEVVALGAAVQAQALVGGSGELLLLDVTPHALGIMIAGGFFRALVPANSTVPTSASHVFTTVQDNQTTVKIVVLQGQNQMAAQNELLGEFTLTNLPPGPRGSVQIEVSFEISAEGIVYVSGTNLATGDAQSIEVAANDKLTEAELQAIIREQLNYAVDDVDEVSALLNEVERMMPAARTALGNATILERTDAFLAQTRKLVGAGDKVGLEQAKEQLVKVKTLFQGLTQR
jgi:molecular chaperone DnaK